MQRAHGAGGNVRRPVVARAQVDAALGGVVVAVEGDRQTLLPHWAGRVAGSRGPLGLRVRDGVTKRHTHVVMIGAFRFVVHVRLVDQGDVVDRVRDDELRVRLEVVNGVPRLRPFDAVIQGATESFHHPDLYVKGAG